METEAETSRVEAVQAVAVEHLECRPTTETTLATTVATRLDRSHRTDPEDRRPADRHRVSGRELSKRERD